MSSQAAAKIPPTPVTASATTTTGETAAAAVPAQPFNLSERLNYAFVRLGETLEDAAESVLSTYAPDSREMYDATESDYSIFASQISG